MSSARAKRDWRVFPTFRRVPAFSRAQKATLAKIANDSSSGPFMLLNGTNHIAPAPSMRAAQCFGVYQGGKVR